MLSPKVTAEERLTPERRTHLATTARRKAEHLWDAEAYRAPLGNNPLLTITALAERIADLIVTDPRHSLLFQPPRARHDPPVKSM